MLEGFPHMTGISGLDRFSIEYDGTAITVFTGRSAERDLAQLKKLLQEATPGSIPVIVAPYRREFAALFTRGERFIFIAPVSFATELPKDDRLIADTPALEYFVNGVGKDDKFEIHVVPQWQALADEMRQAAQRLFERAAVRLRTIRHFGRLWQINFRLNAVGKTVDVARLKAFCPDLLVMAGPSLDSAMHEVGGAKLVWCADTALPALASHGIYPQVVFSVDAGYASSEHFCGLASEIRKRNMVLVSDLLGNAAVRRLPFKEKLTYQSSHPLVQHFCHSAERALTAVENPRGDVGSLMRNVFFLLFGDRRLKIIGHDGRSSRKISHARGTAYFQRAFVRQTRLYTPELYLANLSRRFR